MTLRQDQQQPLTRRQLREMERAAQASGGEQQVPAVELPFSSAPPPADLRPALATDAPLPPPAQESEPAAPSAPAAAPVVPLTRRQLRALQQAAESQSQPIAEVPVVEAPAGPQEQPATPVPAPIAHAPITALPLPQASVPAPPVISEAPATDEAAAQLAEPEVIDSAPLTTGEVRAYQPPTGHWSLGANESFDDVLSAAVTDAHIRSVESSGGSSTTNALIMPVVPSAVDMTGPLNATGEILLTGSIDLPRGLGATGQVQGRFDGSDIDRLLDQHDRDAQPNSSVEPVAATRAISTHAPSTGPNIVPPKKTSHKVGAIAGSVAGGVALLGVAGVLVAGFIFHAF